MRRICRGRYTPKGCGFLWTRGDFQPRIQPTVLSSESGGDYHRDTAQGKPFADRRGFTYVGTRDYTNWAAVPAAFEFRRSLPGGEAACMGKRLELSASFSTVKTFRIAAPGGAAMAAVVRPVPSFGPPCALTARVRVHLCTCAAVTGRIRHCACDLGWAPAG